MRSTGFTLLELMIVVAIIGVITAIAIPSYQESVQKSRRAEARGQLLEVAQYLQRFYSQNDSFSTDRSGAATAIPSALAMVPRTADAGNQAYDISFTTAAPGSENPSITAFKIQAVRKANGPMATDKCGDFVVDNTGARSVLKASDSVANCWK
jgi:type IV pilus assembly protein PilE